MSKKCLGCPEWFYPKRNGQVYHSALCGHLARAKAKRAGTPSRTVEQVPYEDAFVDTLLALKPPKDAIGYRLFCRELDVWLPLRGSQRWDGSKPRNEHYRLRPVEIPLVPLRTVYLLDWVMVDRYQQKAERPILVLFARETRCKELAWRLKSYRLYPPVLPPLPYEPAALMAAAHAKAMALIEAAAPQEALLPPSSHHTALTPLPELTTESSAFMPPTAGPPAAPPEFSPQVNSQVDAPGARQLSPLEILEAIKQLGPEGLAAFQSALAGTSLVPKG